jgi:hypothetical protein
MLRPLLLHLANSRPPVCSRAFYDLKSNLLRRHGRRDGYDVQEIIKKCWGPWNHEGDSIGCTGKPDCRCGGTGIFRRDIHGLERWRWGGFVFHCPIDRVPGPLITIRGHIQHKKYPGRLPHEAALWLYLLCGEWRLLCREITSSYCFGWYLWPLTNLQRILTTVARWLNRHDCIYCRRRFFTRGTGWCVCPTCRKRDREAEDFNPNEIPF